MAVDKLSIINDALAELGDNLVPTADDGSDEWNCASPAYENAVKETLERHSWDFDTNIATLVRVGASPDDLYEDAMAMPNGCLHLIWVRRNDTPADYKIINNTICLSLNGWAATAKFVVDQGTGAWPAQFAAVIRARVMAALLSGLHEDFDAALKARQLAETLLQQAMTRIDQQQPKRATFNSRAIGARIVRRPFVNMPYGWGGTGTPN